MMPGATFSTELKAPPDDAFGSLVESFVADAARRSGLPDERVSAVAATARRGFETMVKHALAESREPIRVVAACTPVRLDVSLFERGLPMDDVLARRDPCWNELYTAVDAAHWRCHGMAGSELRLTVAHPRAAAAEATPASEEPVPPAPAQEYVIRRFAPGDAAGVARAFYLTYGYAYDFSAVYAPSRLIELNASGSYLSIVAVSTDGEVVGHYALVREGSAPIADAAGAVVLPAHRGRDLLNRLRDRAEAEAIEEGLAAYYSEPVTDHPRTQLASESFNAKACGITLGVAPRTFVARHMELSTTTQRQSCMLYVKVLRQRGPRMTYVPPQHRNIVSRIYEELGLPVIFREGVVPSGRGAFHTTFARGDEIGTIEVASIGAETAELMRQSAEDLRATQRLGAIYVSLPLEDPGAPALCTAMESCGFFFAGVGPWMLDGKDSLRLQMPLTPIDLSALVVVSDLGKALLAYIGAERSRCANA